MGILVTGGAGFIGSHLVDALVSQDEEILVLDDLSAGNHNLKLLKKTEKVHLLKGSVTNRELVENCVKKCSQIYHLAAMNRAPRSIEDPIRANNINVNGTLNILEAARKYEVDKIVFASSSSVYGRSEEFPRLETGPTKPNHPYAVGKLASEYYCDVYYRLFGLKVTILRYFAVYGPRQSPKMRYAAVIPIFIRNCIEGKPITVFGDGSQMRNFTFVLDTVKATILAMKLDKTNGKIINIANDQEFSLNAVINVLEEVSGDKLEVIYDKWRKGDVKRAPADISLAKALLGELPMTGIKRGIQSTFEWNLKNSNYFG